MKNLTLLTLVILTFLITSISFAADKTMYLYNATSCQMLNLSGTEHRTVIAIPIYAMVFKNKKIEYSGISIGPNQQGNVPVSVQPYSQEKCILLNKNATPENNTSGLCGGIARFKYIYAVQLSESGNSHLYFMETNPCNP